METNKPVTVNRSAWVPWVIGGSFAAALLLPLSAAWSLATDLGHAWVVPLLMGYLWWERWTERPDVTPRDTVGARWWLLAVGLIALQVPLRLLLTPFPLWTTALSIYCGVVAVAVLVTAWLVGGLAATRWVSGPMLLLLAALPAPTFVEVRIIGPMREVIAALAAEVCNLVGQPAIASGTSVRLANNWVGIDEACGGIRSLQACLMIGLFFGEWFRFSLLRRVGLVLVGAGCAMAGNFSRVVFLALRASDGAGAVTASHDSAGWAAMGVSLVLTAWIACRWAGYQWPSVTARARSAVVAAPALWRWGVVVVGVFLATELATRAWFARGEVNQGNAPRWAVRFPQGNVSFRPEPLSEPARDMLRPDSFAAGTWQAAPDVTAAAFYVEWQKGQIARSAAFKHNPTVCLPFSGCELLQTLSPLEVAWAGGQITFFPYKFRRLGEDIIVAFTIWDPLRGRVLEKPENKRFSERLAWRWTEVREARQHQPAQLFTASLPWSDDAVSKIKTLLEKMIVEPRP